MVSVRSVSWMSPTSRASLEPMASRPSEAEAYMCSRP